MKNIQIETAIKIELQEGGYVSSSIDLIDKGNKPLDTEMLEAFAPEGMSDTSRWSQESLMLPGKYRITIEQLDE